MRHVIVDNVEALQPAALLLLGTAFGGREGMHNPIGGGGGMHNRIGGGGCDVVGFGCADEVRAQG